MSKSNNPNYKARAKNLNKLVTKLRGGIKRRRSLKSRIVATLEAAETIVSNPNYWREGAWFFTYEDGELSYEPDGHVVSQKVSTYDDLINVCGTDANVCGVCAEGAIHLAANSIVDGNAAIDALNNTNALKKATDPEDYKEDPQFAYGDIQEINDNHGRAKTVKVFREGIAELKKEWKIK